MTTTQNFYPVFENGQVLLSAGLNDIIDYLEPQDRLTRSRLVGIGVVCGLALDWNGTALVIGNGVAVTSEGFLIAEPEVRLDRTRPYKLPQPDANSATPEEKTQARYPFLFDGDTQVPAFELLPTSFVAAPGEAAPTPLSAQFLAGKTVMLFLERNRVALKNCNINDCSDKGSEMRVTLRRLLVGSDTADKILQREAEIAKHPVDRAGHPRLALSPLAMEKLNLLGAKAGTWPTLMVRQVQLALELFAEAMTKGRAAFDAYRPLLAPLWPSDRFPQGPLPTGHWSPPLAHWLMQPVLGQCLYDAAHATTLALNEFLAAAAVYDAECSPDEARFPRHVLLGDPLPLPRAFAGAPTTIGAVRDFDAKAIRTGAVPEMPPAERRHHFVPSPIHGGGCAEELRSLYQRFVGIAQCYDTRGLVGASVRITPSRDGSAALGERAIPAWLRFDPDSDLFANWSWPKSRTLRRATISAYALTPDDLGRHPLQLRNDAVDFYRIEGLVGRPLGSTMAELVRQKRALGLSFAIEPVMLPTGGEGDVADTAAAQAVMRRLLLCQMRELDVVFLTLMQGIFSFMVWLVRTLGPVHAIKATKGRAAALPVAPPPEESPRTISEATSSRMTGLRLRPITLDLVRETALNDATERILTDLRGSRTPPANLLKKLAFEESGAEEPPLAVATLFDRARNRHAGGELIDRVAVAVREADPTADAEAAYPAVALMARAEEMMAAASAESLAEFDQARFTTAMRGLAEAYEGYAARAETDARKVGSAIAAANTAILDNRANMAAAAQQLGGSAVTAELNKRLAALFQGQILGNWLKRNPGAEHKGGVGVGGTLVLLYVERSALRRGLDALGRLAVRALAPQIQRLGDLRAQFDTSVALESLASSSAARGDDPLDRFVVVGDLCLPTFCCHAECGEDEVFARFLGGRPMRPPVPPPQPTPEPPPAPTPPAPTPEPTPEPPAPSPTRTGTLKGRVVRGRERVTRLGNAILEVTNGAGVSNASALRDGEFTLTLPTGRYRVQVIAGRLRTRTAQVTIEPGATVEVELDLQG